MAKQEQKDIKQRIEQGEFAQSAEISASYLDEDILIIDNIKVLANPDKYHVYHAIKFGDYNVGRSKQLLTIPLYMAFLLRQS